MSNTTRKPVNKELKAACAIVERFARGIGKDCQIIFTAKGVEVAPLEWAGSVMEPTLYDALQEADGSTRR